VNESLASVALTSHELQKISEKLTPRQGGVARATGASRRVTPACARFVIEALS
jgi:hypothetical protein